MRVHIIAQAGTYHLVQNGKTSILSEEELRTFIENFDSQSSSVSNIVSFADPELTDGELVAQINDDGHLVILSGNFFRRVFSQKEINYLTIDEYAEKVGRKRGIVLRMCRDGRIPGVIQRGSRWLIPADAPYPKDARCGKRV